MTSVAAVREEPVGLTAEEVFSNAKGLVDEIRTRAAEVSHLRTLPPDLLTKLKESGVFAMAAPLAWGGPEMTPQQQAQVIEMLAAADPSVAWCVAVGMGWGYFVGWLPDATARKLFPSLNISAGGVGQPSGRAERVPGGFRLNGHWSFGSNTMNADVIMAAGLVVDNDKADDVPDMRFFIAPASSWVIIDNWDTTGLAGSGSVDFEADDLFFPEAHTVSMGGGLATRNIATRSEPLYGWAPWYIGTIAAVPLGLARAAIDEVKRIASDPNRKIGYSRVGEPNTMKDVPRVRAAIARAEMHLGAARAYHYHALDMTWDEVSRGGPVSLSTRLAVATSRLHAFQTGREIAQAMYDTAGARALYWTSPLDRWLRDSVTSCMHQMGQDRMLETMGAGFVGGEVAGGFI